MKEKMVKVRSISKYMNDVGKHGPHMFRQKMLIRLTSGYSLIFGTY